MTSSKLVFVLDYLLSEQKDLSPTLRLNVTRCLKADVKLGCHFLHAHALNCQKDENKNKTPTFSADFF